MPPHGYVTKPYRIGSRRLYVCATRDEIYVPVAVQAKGDGPFPAIIMGAATAAVACRWSNGGALQHPAGQDIARGYVVVYVNYRNEIPYHYETRNRKMLRTTSTAKAAR